MVLLAPCASSTRTVQDSAKYPAASSLRASALSLLGDLEALLRRAIRCRPAVEEQVAAPVRVSVARRDNPVPIEYTGMKGVQALVNPAPIVRFRRPTPDARSAPTSAARGASILCVPFCSSVANSCPKRSRSLTSMLSWSSSSRPRPRQKSDRKSAFHRTDRSICADSDTLKRRLIWINRQQRRQQKNVATQPFQQMVRSRRRCRTNAGPA